MEPVSGDEYIIRRIPPPRPSMDFITQKSDGLWRATSAALHRREGEMGLSCSRLAITSPKQLLAQINASVHDGWEVCIWKVSDIPEGLSVVITPSSPPELDPGHCEIRSQNFTDRLRSKLAKASVVLTHAQVETMRAGDSADVV